jgi:ABC-2 type transport system permease protein
MLASALTMLMHVALIWTLSGEGLNRIMPSLVTVLSGNIVPLPLFPDWLQPFLNFQPFRGLVDVPFRIYVGDISVAAAFPDILQQVFWIVVIVLLGRWLLTRSMATMVVQGG